LYIVGGAGDRQFSLVAYIGGAPAESARLVVVIFAPAIARRISGYGRVRAVNGRIGQRPSRGAGFGGMQPVELV